MLMLSGRLVVPGTGYAVDVRHYSHHRQRGYHEEEFGGVDAGIRTDTSVSKPDEHGPVTKIYESKGLDAPFCMMHRP